MAHHVYYSARWLSSCSVVAPDLALLIYLATRSIIT
jgi:hypothetical protein